MPESKVDRLSSVPLFARCSKRDLQFLATRVDEVSVQAGKTLLTEGKPTDSFFILLRGNARVLRRGKLARRLTEGDFFGEIGMLDRGPATATVITETPVDALVLSHVQFRDAIKTNQNLATKIMAAMADRLRADTLV